MVVRFGIYTNRSCDVLHGCNNISNRKTPRLQSSSRPMHLCSRTLAFCRARLGSLVFSHSRRMRVAKTPELLYCFGFSYMKVMCLLPHTGRRLELSVLNELVVLSRTHYRGKKVSILSTREEWKRHVNVGLLFNLRPHTTLPTSSSPLSARTFFQVVQTFQST